MKNLKTKKDTELTKMLTDNREDLRKLRFEKISGAMKNPSRIKILKKDIARIMTEMNVRGGAIPSATTKAGVNG